MKNSALKLIFGGLWLSLFLFVLYNWWQSDIALTSIPTLLQEWLDNDGLVNAALIYIVLYAIRPLILFPATLLTIVSGLIFSPWLGTLHASDESLGREAQKERARHSHDHAPDHALF